MKNIVFNYTICILRFAFCNKFKPTFALSLSKCAFILFLTFHFSLFTFSLGAQGLTKYGESTSGVSTNFVDKNGKIGNSPALNKYGQVLVVPGAPTIGTAVAGDAQASVPFTAPASNGGSTITSYTATSSPGYFIGTLSQAGSGTITVAGLTNLTAYTFTVTATNAVGTGTASAPSNSVTPPGIVTSSTGKVWMDRNLGATQVATSSTDEAAYGYLYQWGRLTDGHQIRTSGTTSTLSGTDIPGHANFIKAPVDPYDWRNGQNGNLWQGVNGVNNPCPSGFRIPTDAELEAERASWVGGNNATGAFGSPLKLTVAGYRYSNGSLDYVGSNGLYWSSTVDGTNSRYLFFYSSDAAMYSANRAFGFSVRCIKAGPAPDAPGIGTAVAGNTQASVPFTAPASNGGSTITSYTATSSPGGFTGTLSQEGSGTITVSGLTNGTAYTFTVTATNANGISAASSASNSVTPVVPSTVPGAPTIGTATAGNAQATVTFTAPVSNGGSAITSYTATSTPGSFTGTLTQAGSGTITVAGLTNLTAYTFTVTASNAVGTGAASAPSNSVIPGTVTSADSRIWMDRNLGATQVATSSTDVAAYGNLYQWGRAADGHQFRTSGTTSTLSITDTPGHANFILAPNTPFDWRNGQNVSLWQGLTGTNNPCPSGFRIPTNDEFIAEIATWSAKSPEGAFASPLKLPMAGIRYNSGSLSGVGSIGYYWSSTVSGTISLYLVFYVSNAYTTNNDRASGLSVRCIKD